MKVFIACGSNSSIPKEYIDETRRVCKMLCNLDCSLVFGAYSKGMMGECYKVFKENNKDIIGVTLDAYQDDLVNIPGIKVISTDTSFKRLEIIFEISDLYLILPSGTGTLNELFGILEEYKTNKQNKKIILYNYKGYFKELFELFDKLVYRGFAYKDVLDNLIIVENLKDLEGEIKNERN